MATLSPTQVVQTGASATATSGYTAAEAGGDKFPPGDNVWLIALNLSGSSITVTVDSPTPCNQGHFHDEVVAVPALQGRMFGPFPANRFAGTDGLAAATYSSHTSLWVRPWVI